MSFQKSRYRPQSYSYRRNSRRGRGKNFKPLIIFIFALALIGWLGYKVINFFAGNDVSQSAEATLEIKQGTAEFALGGSEEELWTRANSGQTFLQGDKLKTMGNGIAAIDILGSASLFLKPETEITFSKLVSKESGEKNIQINLEKGEIWVKVVEDDFSSESKSSFIVKAARSETFARGTIFDVYTNGKDDIIRLSRGKVDVDVFGENKNNIRNVAVGVGQKLIVDETTFNKVESGDIVLDINDTDFVQSEWNLSNLAQFYPQEAAKIRGEIEKSAEKVESTSENENIDPEIEAPIIIEPENEYHVPASEELVVITGTVGDNVFQVAVNGYTLTKFQPGDRKWSYFASRKFGTMVPGENKYSVKAIRRDGKESAPTDITIFYDGFNSPQNGDVSQNFKDLGVRALDINNFNSPEILKPVRLDQTEPYQTSSEVVTISGIVDPKTNRVEVNGFQLRKFQPGDTDFSYIANAKYGNMKKGENVYEIFAYGPDGKKASSSIKIIYTPLEL